MLELCPHAPQPAREPLSARTVRIHDVDAVYPVAGRTVATMEELREELQAVKREGRGCLGAVGPKRKRRKGRIDARLFP